MLFLNYDDSAQAEAEREQEARERGREDEIEGAFVAGLRRAQELKVLARAVPAKTLFGDPSAYIDWTEFNQAIDAEAGKERS